MSDVVIIERDRPVETVVVDRPIREITSVVSSNPLVPSGGSVIGEIPNGLINGSNAIFTTTQNFVPGSVRLFVNGLRQTIVDDYQTVGVNTINLNVSLNAGEHITVDYTVA